MDIILCTDLKQHATHQSIQMAKKKKKNNCDKVIQARHNDNIAIFHKPLVVKMLLCRICFEVYRSIQKFVTNAND